MRVRSPDAHIGLETTATARLDRRDAAATIGGRLLHAFEVDHGAAVVEECTELGVLRGGEIALRLHDEEVRGEAHVETGLLGLETRLGELTRDGRGLVALQAEVDLQRGVGDLGRDRQLERARATVPPTACAAPGRARNSPPWALPPSG